MSNILEVKDLNISLKKEQALISAVDHVSFSLKEKETLGIIGESGSGKSLTCSGILGLLPPKRWKVQGEVFVDGESIPYEDNAAMSFYRGNRIALIMQNPMSAFNPMITIGKHFYESINKPGASKRSKSEVAEIAIEMMTRMRIRDPATIMKYYSFQLSGGMLQRIMIALALVMEPNVLIADEPTTALDLTIQHEIIKLLREVQENCGTAILLVSHDLGVISHLSTEIAVMYAGSIVEKGAAEEILSQPLHPYTQGLFRSRPNFTKNRLPVLEGQPPTLFERGAGCQFYSRCSFRQELCQSCPPKSIAAFPGHEVRCGQISYKETFNYGIA